MHRCIAIASTYTGMALSVAFPLMPAVQFWCTGVAVPCIFTSHLPAHVCASCVAPPFSGAGFGGWVPPHGPFAGK
eukprot:8811806-Alexandrium_andersonii.AAC.1